MKFKFTRLLFISSLGFLICITHLASAKEFPRVSVFDVKQEKVITEIPLTSELKSNVFEVLQSSPVTYGGFTLNPNNGLVLHIPFPYPIRIDHKFYTHKIKELYLFLEHDSNPKALLFFESDKDPSIVLLHYDTEKFITNNHLSTLW